MSHELETAIDLFPWVSDEQRKGYLAFLSYQNDMGLIPEYRIIPEVAFLIQKQHEAAEYWRETTSTQISSLEALVGDLSKNLDSARREIQLLSTSHRSQAVALEEIQRSSGKRPRR